MKILAGWCETCWPTSDDGPAREPEHVKQMARPDLGVGCMGLWTKEMGVDEMPLEEVCRAALEERGTDD